MDKPVSEMQISLNLNEAREDWVLEWQWHQLDHTQTICTSLQTDSHTNNRPHSIFTGRMLFLTPNQQHESTEGIKIAQQCFYFKLMYSVNIHVQPSYGYGHHYTFFIGTA